MFSKIHVARAQWAASNDYFFCLRVHKGGFMPRYCSMCRIRELRYRDSLQRRVLPAKL